MIVPALFTTNFTLPAFTDAGVTVRVIGPFRPLASPSATCTTVGFAFVGDEATAVPAPTPSTPTAMARAAAAAARP